MNSEAQKGEAGDVTPSLVESDIEEESRERDDLDDEPAKSEKNETAVEEKVEDSPTPLTVTDVTMTNLDPQEPEADNLYVTFKEEATTQVIHSINEPSEKIQQVSALMTSESQRIGDTETEEKQESMDADSAHIANIYKRDHQRNHNRYNSQIVTPFQEKRMRRANKMDSVELSTKVKPSETIVDAGAQAPVRTRQPSVQNSDMAKIPFKLVSPK